MRNRYGWTNVGKYRVGTSYRRNVEHLPKEKIDENKMLWKRSRQDWRHRRGSRRGCSGCAYCVPPESWNRGGFRAKIRDLLKRGIDDENIYTKIKLTRNAIYTHCEY